LTLDRPLHVGDLFGPLVDEHHHEVDLGVVRRDGVGHLLHDDRLAGLGRGDDEAALALADRGDEVDDALGELLRPGLQPQVLLRVERGELGELRTAAHALRRGAVHRVEADERVELLPLLLALLRLTHRTGDRVTAAQSVLLHLVERDVDVVRARQVAARADERVVLEDVEDAGDGEQDVVLAHLGLVVGRVVRTAGAALAVAVAVAPAVPAPALAVGPAGVAAVLVVTPVVDLVARRGQLDGLERLDGTLAVHGLTLLARGGGLLRLRATLPARTLGDVGQRQLLLGPGRTLPGPLGAAAALGTVGALGAVAAGLGRVRTCGAGGAARGGGPVGALRLLGGARRARRGGGPAGTAAARGSLGRGGGLLGRGCGRLGRRSGGLGRRRRRGGGAAPPVRPGSGGGGTAPGLADRGDEVTLAHPARALEPHLAGERLELGEAHGTQRATRRTAGGGIKLFCREVPSLGARPDRAW